MTSKSLIIASILSVVEGLFLLSPKSAFASVTLEQHINIIDQEYSTTSQTAFPTDNALGLIHWDDDKYSGETVYFEAVIRCDSCSGGSNQVKAELYSSGGVLVTNATATRSSNTYDLVRSSAITGNLTDDADYSVRLTMDATTGTAYIKGARLIVVQSDTVITDSETQIEVGNKFSTTNTVYQLITAPKLFSYAANTYAPTPLAYFEATLQSSDSEGVAYAVLSSDVSCATPVSGSEVSVTGTTWARARSNNITLTPGSSYFICVKSTTGDTTSLANAKVILDQTHAFGISLLQTYHQMINTYASDTDTTYTPQESLIEFNPGHFSGALFNFYFESILSTNTGTAYAELYNSSDAAAITGSEHTTSSTAFTRVRSAEITSNMPSSTKKLDTQIKNSATNTTSISESVLVIQMTAHPSLSFTIEGVTGGTATNGVTTSLTSEPDTLAFGSLTPSTPKYLAHRLTTSTNTAHGYTVSMKMISTLQGYNPANIIEEFPTTWSSPQTWTEPTGTTANVNTGWIGANTSDTRVSGWSSGSGLFGPVGTTSRTIMTSPGIDGGTSAYVTYVIEVNQYQPTDTYAGTLVYNIVPTY